MLHIPCHTPAVPDGIPAAGRPTRDHRPHRHFVRLGGVMFAAGLGVVPPLTPGEPLGAAVATVRCTLSNEPSNHADPPLVDGTASFLAVGTEIHAVPGFPATCRVAALRDGTVHVYLAQHEVDGRSQATDCASHPGAGT